MPTFEERAQKIQIILFDVDGIMTDGSLYFCENGSEIKTFNILDGQGIKLLQKAGLKTGIITGRKSTMVEKRASDLGIDYLFQGREDKIDVLDKLLGELELTYEQVAYMGDDLPDLPIIRRVGLGITVANGHPIVAEHAYWQTEKSGGQGAVRELCDKLLTARGELEALLQPYLN